MLRHNPKMWPREFWDDVSDQRERHGEHEPKNVEELLFSKWDDGGHRRRDERLNRTDSDGKTRGLRVVARQCDRFDTLWRHPILAHAATPVCGAIPGHPSAVHVGQR